MAKKQTKSVKNKGKAPSHETVVTSNTKKQGIFEFLRFGESYTSLVLGIIVVILATILLLSLLHNRTGNQSIIQTNNTAIESGESTTRLMEGTPSATVEPSVTVTSSPTKVVAKAVTVAPTTKPTVTKAPTLVPTKKVNPTAVPTKVVAKEEKKTQKGKTYTVAAGDSLWTIAEKEYKSGYNWVDIAKANKLQNPSAIYKGMKLTMPSVAAKISTVKAKTVVDTNKIAGTSYKIVKGDTLWNIAVRAYGDGYKWVEIAKANGLKNPNLIHTQNSLKIPRGK